MLAVQTHGASVETIEGLSDSGEIADLQAAFRDRNALQCGFCTPGMLMAAQDLLISAGRAGPRPDPRASFRQLLPLHRLPGHRRCRRNHGTRAHRTQAVMAKAANPEGPSVLDRPNSYIGKLVPRPNLERLMQGRGLYVSDIDLPRMAHVVFLRSPYAHAKILSIDAEAARRAPGVIAVVTGERARGRHHAVGRRAVASEGSEIRAPARDRDRPCLLAGRGGRGHRGDQPRRRRGRRRNRRGRIPTNWSR